MIHITGKQNVKNFTQDNTREIVKTWSIPEKIYENKNTQHEMLSSLYLTDSCLHKSELNHELCYKIQGYTQQDKTNKMFDTSSIITMEKLLELLIASNLKCHYCLCDVYVLYKTIRQDSQWTLDRLDNALGHSKDNCVISCYKCNVQKKRMNDKTFRFSKQLKLIKKN